MTGKEFTNKVTHSSRDFLEEFIDLLERNKIQYCVIGGLAVNAYAEPVVSLDLDIIIATNDTEKLLAAFSQDYIVKKEKHSTNISVPFSDLRIQIQTDTRYQEFIAEIRKTNTEVSASVEAAFQDTARRQKIKLPETKAPRSELRMTEAGKIIAKIDRSIGAWDNLLDLVTFEIQFAVIGFLTAVVVLFSYHPSLGLLAGGIFVVLVGPAAIQIFEGLK